jgi:nucleotide-binding universal stress UspA family protein
MKANQSEVIARRRVVAGVDGSPNSLLALRRTVYAARLCHARVELVRVGGCDARAGGGPAARQARARRNGMTAATFALLIDGSTIEMRAATAG